MGILGEVVRIALSKPQKNEYVVYDQHDRPYRVKAATSDDAMSEVIRHNPLTVHADRCWVRKIR